MLVLPQPFSSRCAQLAAAASLFDLLPTLVSFLVSAQPSEGGVHVQVNTKRNGRSEDGKQDRPQRSERDGRQQKGESVDWTNSTARV